MLTAQLYSNNIERSVVLKKTERSKDSNKSPVMGKIFKNEIKNLSPFLESVRTEAGNDFLQYLHWLQLEDEQNLMTLSSTHHYYYDEEDMKDIKILINLKPLNSIKDLKNFLNNLVKLMPRESRFIGYFKNTIHNKSVFSLSQSTVFFQSMINYIDLKTNNSLTKSAVSRLLRDHKLNVVDITDINDMTYFCSQTT